MLKRIALFFDLIFCVGTLLWWAGGVRIGEHVYLSHGAEPRRAALIALCFVVFVPSLRGQSRVAPPVIRFVRSLGQNSRLMWACLAGVALLAAAVGVAQMAALRYPVFDVGIFHQIVWALSRGLGFHSTLSGAGDFLLDHLTLSLVLLTPFYRLFDASPYILPLLHSVLIFGGVAAWIQLARRESDGASPLLIGLVLVLSLGWDSLWANLRWGFHENAIAFFAFSWAITLARGSLRAWQVSYVFLLVGCLSKETLLLTGAVAGVFWPLLQKDGKSVGVKVWIFALSWLALMSLGFVLFQLKEHAPDKNYFVRYYSYLGVTLPEMLKALVTRPWSVIEAVGGGALTRYFIAILVPFLFAPIVVLFRARQNRAAWALVLMPLPSIATQALSTYAPLRDPGLHYVLEIWPFWMAASVLLWARLWRHKPMQTQVWVAVVVALQLFRLVQDPIANLRDYGRGAAHAAAFRRTLSSLSVDASLAVADGIGTWVSARKLAVRWPEGSRFLSRDCPDYFLVSEGTDLGLCQSRVNLIASFEGWRLLSLSQH